MVDDEGLPTTAPAVVEGHEVHEESAAELAPEATAAAPKRRGLVILCVILGVAAAAFAVIAALATAQLDDERGDREEVEEVSGRFASALLTYDYRDLEGAKKRVLDMSTGKFKAEYEKAFDGGLDKLFEATQSRSAGTVTDVFVGPIESDTVTSIAVVDAVSSGTAGGRRLVSSYIELQLVKVGGRWKVDGVSNLNLTAPTSEAVVPGASTTTTTAAP
jgi:predicted outer membrane lipoprotein